jgi:aryl-alcohol dehydrogenase-like predicted oxidoreductase
MDYVTLGRTGLQVSRICLGCMSYGQAKTQGVLQWHWTLSEEDSRPHIKRALEAGINFFDTANVYSNGESEEVLGRAIRDFSSRDEVVLATKVWGPVRPGPNGRGLSRKSILSEVDKSLKRLATDYIDLYIIHRFDYETPLEETFQAFADVVRQGKALYIGVSEWTAEQLREGHALAKSYGIQLISNQPQYSMLWRVIEGKVVPASEELGISQIVWSPMAQGVLSGKYLPGQPVPEGSRATDEKSGADSIQRFLRDDVLEAVQRLKPIADQAGLSMPQLAIAWVLQNPNVAAALVGASRPEQLADTVKASGVKLDADTMAAIDEALGDVPNTDSEDTYTVSPKERVV